jgi:hypothetical protein
LARLFVPEKPDWERGLSEGLRANVTDAQDIYRAVIPDHLTIKNGSTGFHSAVREIPLFAFFGATVTND